jgi:hypothetical protein
VIFITLQTSNSGVTFDQKTLLKILIYVAVLVAVVIIALAALVFAVSFFFHLAFSLLLQACIAADHAGVLTQVLLLLVVGFLLYRAGNYGLRAARAFLNW